MLKDIKLKKLKEELLEDSKILYSFTNTFYFSSLGELAHRYIEASYRFAWKMSFTEEGHHRRKRSGGIERRSSFQIFCDTFNGKLGEFSLYQHFTANGIEVPYPDLSISGIGKWDSCDFTFKIGTIEKNISIKTTKSTGNLLLLETKDWNENGEYIPNLKGHNVMYDDFLLVRVDSNIKKILNTKGIYSKEQFEEKNTMNFLCERVYEYDIAGVVSADMLKKTIFEKNILKQGGFLQSQGTVLDADNYYVQSGDMYETSSYLTYLKSLNSVIEH